MSRGNLQSIRWGVASNRCCTRLHLPRTHVANFSQPWFFHVSVTEGVKTGDMMDVKKDKLEERYEKGEDEQVSGTVQDPTRLEQPDAPASESKESEPEVKAKTGRAKRREKRLKHEPHSVAGESLSTVNKC